MRVVRWAYIATHDGAPYDTDGTWNGRMMDKRKGTIPGNKIFPLLDRGPVMVSMGMGMLH